MNKNSSLKTYLRVSIALVVLAMAVLPQIAGALFGGGDTSPDGMWLETGRSEDLNYICPTNMLCVEWCAQGGTQPTGQFCCVRISDLPSSYSSDCAIPVAAP